MAKIEPYVIGYPPLVTLDLYYNTMFLTAEDVSLYSKTFEVVINCHVAINETFQEPFNQYMPPFKIKVFDDNPYKPPNTGPRIENMLSSLFLHAEESTKINIGKPVDIE